MYLDDLKLNLKYCDYDFSKYMLFPYKMTDIGLVTIDIRKNVEEIKEQFITLINKKFNINLDKEYVLLRDYLGERPTKVNI